MLPFWNKVYTSRVERNTEVFFRVWSQVNPFLSASYIWVPNEGMAVIWVLLVPCCPVPTCESERILKHFLRLCFRELFSSINAQPAKTGHDFCTRTLTLPSSPRGGFSSPMGDITFTNIAFEFFCSSNHLCVQICIFYYVIRSSNQSDHCKEWHDFNSAPRKRFETVIRVLQSEKGEWHGW